MGVAQKTKLEKREVMNTTELKALHSSIAPTITNRLNEFIDVFESGGEDLMFKEMCFCVCTPQTNAQKGWLAASLLEERNLFHASQEEIGAVLREAGVRFHKNKSRYIVQNRDKFYGKIYSLLKLDTASDEVDLRNKLAKEVSGWGLKEASHFMRNVGLGKEVCILDRHILRQLNKFDVIPEVPKMLPLKLYLDIEKKMKIFARDIKIRVEDLDFVFWYIAKGEVFK